MRKGTLAGVMTILALAVSACGGSTSGKGNLTFDAFDPFSGPDASFGPEVFAGCPPAAKAINAAGGVLGHEISCKTTDSRGDPADAVPAARQLIASTGNLVGIIGPSSDESSATVPLFDRSHIPMWPNTGQTSFNTNPYRYFWRITPPDDAVGFAIALYAYQSGFHRAIGIFGSDISSQGAAPAAVKAFKKLGGTFTGVQSLPLDQASYRTQIAQLAAGNPQAILIEADPQTSATYLAEVKQLYHPVPIIGTDGTIQPPWQKAVSGALGKTLFARVYAGAQPYAPTTGPAHAFWLAQLNAAATQVQKPASQWDNDPYAQATWDGLNISALAMLLAHSTNPVVFNRYIPRVTTGSPGATVVHDFLQGEKAIKAGKSIKYIGATGPIVFDQYQNSPGGFEVVRANGAVITTYTAANLARFQ